MIAWKESLKVKRKALVIKGARQIGKTTITIIFAEQYYKYYVYINFKDNKNLKKYLIVIQLFIILLVICQLVY